MKKKSIRKPPKKNQSIKKETYKFKLFALSNILVFITILILGIVSFIYLQNNSTQDLNNLNLLKEKTKLTSLQKKKEIKDKYLQDNLTFEEKTKALEIEYTNNIDNEIYIKKPTKQINYAKQKFIFDEEIEEPIKYPITDNELDKQIKKIEQIIQKEEKIQHTTMPITLKDSGLPKLAIIIDDIISKQQVKKALNLNYNINMAFLPPTSRHKNSAKITNKLDTYMIHLPLQAKTSRYEEENTLYITDTIDTIEQRIKLLKKLYPKTKFINNHTGSKFTSNKQAMDKLFQILKNTTIHL